jgi:hypothetical protein
MLLATIGMYLLSRMDAQTGRVESSVAMLVLGLGIGMVMQVLILAVQNSVDYSDLGASTAAITFFRSMGGSFGVAAFGAILSARVAAELPRLLPAGTQTGELASLLNSPERIRQLPGAQATAVIQSLAVGVHTVFLWAVPVLVAGFAISWLLREKPLRDTVHVGAASMVEGADMAATEPAEPADSADLVAVT